MVADYSSVTELPGNKADSEQLKRLYQRYRFAQEFCKDKKVLEVACGAGMGLGYLAKVANKVVGGDIDENVLKYAQDHYGGRDDVEVRQLDAHDLPFGNQEFDVVLLYEAIYYLDKPERFVKEAHRVLKDEGLLIICTVNKDWSDFNPSQFSKKYYSAPGLYQLLNQFFPEVKLYGAFPTEANSLRDVIISLLKRTAVTLNLIPKTMKGKEIFRRIFYGELKPLPSEVKDGMVEYAEPVRIETESANSQYKILYAKARV